ncbi:MAG: putative FKBP-type peptidyl-prolyl cis-trans isomerase [Candidatus Woesearchaeota archaeon]|nr:putative FKBP-type peptidyl-prolyl cis-trans isomerase [Candidatus Woesearchaeota archaeon]
MGKIKKKDFVEIEYTGKLAEDDLVFDTTDEKIAKENAIFEENHLYGPVTVCVGEKQILEGMDKNLIGKEENKEYTIKLSAEQGFGKKDAKLLKLIPSSTFRKQKINPVPGLQVNIDGTIGTVKTASGGRVIVDFNHPLSGRDLKYNVTINKIVKDQEKQIQALISILLNQDSKVNVKENRAEIELENKLPDEVVDKLKEEITKLVDVKSIKIKVQEAKKQKAEGPDR